MRKRFGQLRKRHQALFVLSFLVVGGVLTLLLAQAQTPTASLEPETGSIAIPAAAQSGPSASNNNLVKFGPEQPSGPSSPSGEPMPNSDLPGWTLVFTDDFTTDAPLGSFSAAYGSTWRSYNDLDTAARNYAPAKLSAWKTDKVVSVSGGVLDKYLHTEHDAAGKRGAGDYMMSAAIIPKNLPDRLYGRYSVRLKADAVDGYKIAWLLWPQSGVWPRDGEIDFAEMDLTSTVLKAFIHRQDATTGSDQTVFTSSPPVALSSGWHTVTFEWGTTSRWYVDGVLMGTSNVRIPNTPMHMVLQTESELNATETTASGHLQLDWVAVWQPE